MKCCLIFMEVKEDFQQWWFFFSSLKILQFLKQGKLQLVLKRHSSWKWTARGKNAVKMLPLSGTNPKDNQSLYLKPVIKNISSKALTTTQRYINTEIQALAHLTLNTFLVLFLPQDIHTQLLNSPLHKHRSEQAFFQFYLSHRHIHY